MKNCKCLRYLSEHKRYVLFCFSFFLGLLVGALYITCYPIFSSVRLVEYSQMSIVMGFIISALPFIIYYIFVRYSVFYCLFPFAFIRAFTFMYCFSAISVAYADAGWLVRLLLMFSGCFSVPLLLWYAVRQLLQENNDLKCDLLFCLVFILAIRCIDSYVVSPFAMKLLRL